MLFCWLPPQWGADGTLTRQHLSDDTAGSPLRFAQYTQRLCALHQQHGEALASSKRLQLSFPGYFSQ